MNRPAHLAIAILLLCACHRSGTWVDDPGNFERAWGRQPPPDVKVVHSWYWRSSHFTREEIFYFQLAMDRKYIEALASETGLRVQSPDVITADTFEEHRPAWFAPGPPGRYEIWKNDGLDPVAVVMRDKTTGATFIYCLQL